MPRVDFARAFFASGGFATREAGSFTNPEEAAAAARADGAATVVIVGRDETYAAMAAATARRLKAAGGPRRVVLAGHPKPQVAELKEAGVDLFIHLHADALAVLRDLARESGVEVAGDPAPRDGATSEGPPAPPTGDASRPGGGS
jgi:methylmalonyl-CoA mutase cobalamin-binding subunit